MDGAHTFCALVCFSEMQMAERFHQKCDRRGRRRRRRSRSPLHGLLLFEGGAGTLAAPGAYLPRMLSTKEKDASKKAQSAQTASPHCRYSDGQARSLGLSVAVSSPPRDDTFSCHALPICTHAHLSPVCSCTPRNGSAPQATRNKSCDRRALNVLVLSFRPLRLPATPPTGTYCGGCAALTLLYGRLCACYTLV